MSQPIRILLNGAKGRMGLAIANVAASEKAVIAAGVDQGDDIAAHIGAADVVIDFSFHSATLAVAQLCAQHKKPLVIGTTGHTAEEKAAIPPPSKASRSSGPATTPSASRSSTRSSARPLARSPTPVAGTSRCSRCTTASRRTRLPAPPRRS